jgi:hypothetical protein
MYQEAVGSSQKYPGSPIHQPVARSQHTQLTEVDSAYRQAMVLASLAIHALHRLRKKKGKGKSDYREDLFSIEKGV